MKANGIFDKDSLIPVGPDTPFCGTRFSCPPSHEELAQIVDVLYELHKKFPYFQIVLNPEFELIWRRSI